MFYIREAAGIATEMFSVLQVSHAINPDFDIYTYLVNFHAKNISFLVNFHTKIPDFDILEFLEIGNFLYKLSRLVNYKVILYMLQSFDKFCGLLVYYFRCGMLYQKNLTTF
jgi:hypothetical protein